MFAGYRHCKKCGKALMGLFDGALCDECEEEENRRMTKEEAITNLNMISVAFVEPVTKEQRKLIDDTFDMAIKALDQQPCERFEWGIDGNVYKITKAKDGKEICQQVCNDAISRQAVLDVIKSMSNVNPSYWNKCDVVDREDLIDEISELPPVNPQPKTGYWEWVQYDYNPKLGNWHCSECRCIVVECVDKEEKGGIPLYKYCPQCGAKMQESEDNENGIYSL